MKTFLNSTENNLSELAIIFCGKTNEFKVQEDCKTRVFEDIVDISLQEGVPIRVVKYNPILYYSNFLSPKRAFLISFS